MLIDVIGIAAGVAVIATFYSVAALKARAFAILSNALFIWYALAVGLWPVLLLHALLLPLNIGRIALLWRARQAPQPEARPQTRAEPTGWAAARPLRRRAGLPLSLAGDVQPSLCRA
ncbi:MAG: hypothetical protein AAGF78_11830 [Pseudomonadota bacterium]